ncbi:UNVERIFIED_ORG: hypothetical protein ABIB52_002529 [Arthrobacter sp. UYCu721]
MSIDELTKVATDGLDAGGRQGIQLPGEVLLHC